MKRLIICAALALALPGCKTTTMLHAGAAVADAAGAPAPDVLNRTTADEKALLVAAKSIRTAAASAQALVEAGVITPGSPRAMGIANALDRARDAINAAAEARRAGSAQSYTEALAHAEEAVDQVKDIISGGNQ